MTAAAGIAAASVVRFGASRLAFQVEGELTAQGFFSKPYEVGAAGGFQWGAPTSSVSLFTARIPGMPALSEGEALDLAVREWTQFQRALASGKQLGNFNTATVVHDTSTGQYYYGMNRGLRISQAELHPELTLRLPPTSLNKFPLGNCAEVDAVILLSRTAPVGPTYR